MSLKALREKLNDRQAKLKAVFDEAKVDGSDDVNLEKVSKATLKNAFDNADGLKSSADIVKAIQAADAELNEIAQEAEGLEAIQKAAHDLKAREKHVNRPPFPHASGGAASGNYGSAEEGIKSLGEMIAKDDRYEKYAKSGAAGGITFEMDQAFAFDLLAKASQTNTIGSKALFQTGAGYAPQTIRRPGMVDAITRPIQLLDILPTGRTGTDAIKYMEEVTRDGGAQSTAEGAAYGEGAFELEEKTSNVQKITSSIPVTDEQLEDVAQVMSYLDGRLMFAIRQKLDADCLIGAGGGSTLRGLKNTPGIQTQARGTDPVADAFYKAMTKVRVIGRAAPTHHVMHSEDWETVRLMKDADGRYIWGHPSEVGPDRLWGLPVVLNEADAAGTGYVGSFLPPYVELTERKGVSTQVGYVGTQFLQGRRTLRADLRAAITFFRPAAFASVTGLNA